MAKDVSGDHFIVKELTAFKIFTLIINITSQLFGILFLFNYNILFNFTTFISDI